MMVSESTIVDIVVQESIITTESFVISGDLSPKSCASSGSTASVSFTEEYFEFPSTQVPNIEQDPMFLCEKFLAMSQGRGGIYSLKVFVGGLPPDIDDYGIVNNFAAFRPVHVDWPGKSNSLVYAFPPKGFAFLYFACEESIHLLIEACVPRRGRLYFPVSSTSMLNKMAEVRPWKIMDSKAIVDGRFFTKSQFPAFVGGIPRPMTATQLAEVMGKIFGNVGYVVIFVDNRTQYPRGSGVVVFTSLESYAEAISQHFILIDGKCRCIEVKAYSWTGKKQEGYHRRQIKGVLAVR